MKRYWVLKVAYPLPLSVSTDRKLERIVGKARSGSGAGFGERDIDWTFDTQTKANAGATALREAGYTEITVSEYDHDELAG